MQKGSLFMRENREEPSLEKCAGAQEAQTREEQIQLEEKKRRLGFEIKKNSNLIGRYLNALAREKDMDDLTIMHGWIIRFLYEHRAEEIYQKDIEKVCSITKSTVTNILKLMEKKGYIERVSVAGDARLKRIVLTPAGTEIHLSMVDNIHLMESMFQSVYDDDELDQFVRLLTKLENKLTMELQKKNIPDEK